GVRKPQPILRPLHRSADDSRLARSAHPNWGVEGRRKPRPGLPAGDPAAACRPSAPATLDRLAGGPRATTRTVAVVVDGGSLNGEPGEELEFPGTVAPDAWMP